MEDIHSTEMLFQNKDQAEKRIYILEFLSENSSMGDLGQYQTEFKVQGRTICRESSLLLHSIKKEWYGRHFNRFKEGLVALEHGNTGQKKPSQRSKDCIAWLQFFISCVGQYQPYNRTIHLPSCFTRLSIYNRMCEENNSFGSPSIGISQFYSIFRDHFSHVLIPKVSCLIGFN